MGAGPPCWPPVGSSPACWCGRPRAPSGSPKIVVFYSTVLPGFIPRGASVLGWSLVLAAIHAAMGLVWLSGYAYALDRARDRFASPRIRRALDRVTGTVLVALGVRLAAERP
jgi:threonine/homoserine/homoserine lactone efflux protein